MAVESPPQLHVSKFRMDPNYLRAFENKVFIDGPRSARKLANFFALLLFRRP